MPCSSSRLCGSKSGICRLAWPPRRSAGRRLHENANRDRGVCEDFSQMTGSAPLGPLACDAGTLQELMAGKTLACPCCDGPLTPEKLARLLNDVQRLAAAAGDRPGHAGNGAGQPTQMIVD